MKRLVTARSARIIGILILFATLLSCVSRPANPRFFYTLDYIPSTEEPELVQGQPYPVSVHILDSEISQAYTRPQIVQRGLGPEFTYLDNRLWGVELSETLAELIDRRVDAYNLFARTQREYAREESDYEIRSDLSAIEYVNYRGTEQALVRLDYTFWDVSEARAVVQHRGNVQQPIFGGDVALFVNEANTILLDELDEFLRKVVTFLETGEEQLRSTQPSEQAATAEREIADDSEDGEQGSEMGVLILPALSDNENQPFFTVLDDQGDVVASAQFGEPVSLEIGLYDVLLGSGPDEARMRIDQIEVVSRQQTVVEPTWAAMTVNIIEESREPVRLRYDLYEADTGESLGGRISRGEPFVLSQTVWILDPGEYKVIINNRPFNTLRDFVTLNLDAGQYEQLTIVVGGDDTENIVSMIGAGDVDIDVLQEDDSPLSLSSALNASFSFTSTNESTPEDFELIYFLDSEIDTALAYELGSLRYELSNTLAMSFNAAGDEPLRVSSDDFRLSNTLLYSFTETYGLYARVDVDTTLVGEQVVPEDPIDYVKREDGEIVEQQQGAERVQLSPPFFPPTLEEGFGLNITALRTRRIDLQFRGGIGANQTINWETFAENGTTDIGGTTYTVYEALETETDTGFEVSAFATFLLPLNTSISSNAELFVPFDGAADVSLQWENVVNVVLINNVSIYYRFLLQNAETLDGEAYFVQDHGLFVRLNYLIRL
ncbi:MAG: ABC-type transport auxiliary lipoprotein family protein [Spirochaetota bacterium]